MCVGSEAALESVLVWANAGVLFRWILSILVPYIYWSVSSVLPPAGWLLFTLRFDGEKDHFSDFALSVLGSSSVEAQSGSLRPLRRTDRLSDASAVGAQARPRGPAHTLQHPVPHV